MKLETEANPLYYFEDDKRNKVYRIRKREGASLEVIPYEYVQFARKTLRKIVRDGGGISKFCYIPANIIVETIKEFNKVFQAKQDKWEKEGRQTLRFTGGYTESYNSPLHILHHLGEIIYWYRGYVTIVDEDKILHKELKEIYRKRIIIPKIQDYDGVNIEDVKW